MLIKHAGRASDRDNNCVILIFIGVIFIIAVNEVFISADCHIKSIVIIMTTYSMVNIVRVCMSTFDYSSSCIIVSVTDSRATYNRWQLNIPTGDNINFTFVIYSGTSGIHPTQPT